MQVTCADTHFTAAWKALSFFFLPNRGWALITERAYLFSQSCRLGQRELPGLLWMLMRIILQVRKRRSDVATRQSNGFLLCSQDIRRKIQQDTARWVSLTACLWVHLERGRKKRLICLQRELWRCGLNQSGLDKSWMKKELRVPAATKGRSDSITVGIISQRPIIFQQYHRTHYMVRVHS